MTSEASARSALRSATARHHDEVDKLFSAADLTDRAGYGVFLTAQAEAHIGVEDALTRAGAASVVPDWAERCRAALLRADLAELGLPIPASTGGLRLDGEAPILGAAYVLEGSRLGGRLLQRSVPAHLPTRFLGASDSAGWRKLLIVLDEQLKFDEARNRAIRAAIDVFTLFRHSGQRFLNTG